MKETAFSVYVETYKFFKIFYRYYVIFFFNVILILKQIISFDSFSLKEKTEWENKSLRKLNPLLEYKRYLCQDKLFSLIC